MLYGFSELLGVCGLLEISDHKFKVASTCLAMSFSAFLSPKVSGWVFKPHLLHFYKEYHLPSLPAQSKTTQPAACNYIDSTENIHFLPFLPLFFFFSKSGIFHNMSVVGSVAVCPANFLFPWHWLLYTTIQWSIDVFLCSIRTWKEKWMIWNSGEDLYLFILQRRVSSTEKSFTNVFDDIDSFSRPL